MDFSDYPKYNLPFRHCDVVDGGLDGKGGGQVSEARSGQNTVLSSSSTHHFAERQHYFTLKE